MKTAMDKASGLTAWRWHDFRRSFVTALAEHGVAEVVAVADAMLNHRQAASRYGVLRVYQQAKRRPEPDFQVEAIKPKASRPPKDWSHRDEMCKQVLTILRPASEPLSSRDVALELLVTRALDQTDQRLMRLMTKRVGVALRVQRENGVVRQTRGAADTGAGAIRAVGGQQGLGFRGAYEASHRGNRSIGSFVLEGRVS